MKLVVISLLVAVACSKPDRVGRVIAGLTDLNPRLCACKNKDCVDTLIQEWKHAENNVHPSGDEEAAAPAAQRERYEALSVEYGTCRTNYPGHTIWVLSHLTMVKAQACACADKACSDSVQSDFGNWASDNLGPTASADEDAQIGEVYTQIVECGRKFLK